MRGVIQTRFGVAVISVLLIAGIISGVVIGKMMSSTRLMSSGIVKSLGVGIYKDSNCSEVMSSIEWGYVEPGLQYNVSLYIRNEGNTEVTLSLYATDWNPSEAETYMVLSWNYTGQTLKPNQVIPVTLTLSVGNAAPAGRSFSFSIVITTMG